MKTKIFSIFRYCQFKRGFLASEMFLVVALALLLFAIAIYGFGQARQYSRDNTRVSDLKQMASALTLYIDAKAVYPSGCEWSTEPCWKDFLKPYITRVPKDPLNRNFGACDEKAGCLVYRYCRLENGRRFVVSANLETARRNAMGNNPDCKLGGPNQYWVTN